MAPFQVQRKQLDDHKAAAIGTSPLVAEAAVNTQIPGRHDDRRGESAEREREKERERERKKESGKRGRKGERDRTRKSSGREQTEHSRGDTLVSI